MANGPVNLLALLLGGQRGAMEGLQMGMQQRQQQQLFDMQRQRLEMDLQQSSAPPPPAVPPEWTADLQALQADVDPSWGPDERFDYYRRGLAPKWSGSVPYKSFFETIPEAPSPFTLSPGQARFGGGGEEIAGIPPTPPPPPAAARRSVFGVPYDEFQRTWDFVRSYSPSSIPTEELMREGTSPVVQLAMLQKTGGRAVPENLKPEYAKAVSWLKGVFDAFYTNQPLGGGELYGTVDESGNLTRSR